MPSNTNFNPYSLGPTTSHVLWRLPLDIGGLMGGAQGDNAATGAAGGRSTGLPIWNGLQPVCANGRMYYTTTAGYTNGSTTTIHPILHCINEWTGADIYDVPLPITGNASYPGTSGGLSGIAIQMDPFIKGVDASTNETVTPTTYYYDIWVSGGGLWEVNAFTGDTLYYLPLPAGVTGLYSNDNWYLYDYPKMGQLSDFYTFTKTLNWTVSDPFEWALGWSPGWAQISNNPNVIVEEDNGQQQFNFRTRSLSTGAVILNVTFDIASAEKPGCIEDGMLFWHMIDGCVYAFSLTTGQQVWVSKQDVMPWGGFGTYWSSAAYGYVYFGTWDGYLRCYNDTTGAVVWQYYSGNTTETGTGSYPWWGNAIIADGMIYAATGQHTPPNPLPRGDQLYCLNATTGQLIWETPFQSGWGGISSGILYYTNNYDDCLYAFGTGQTATNVTASPNLIQGSVVDNSPGAPGTPCVSADSMTTQMNYLYANAPQPTDTTGVPVTITAIDPNNNTETLGTVTTDASGSYSLPWTPPVSGPYTITTTFAGTGAYYGSSAETHIYISAPTTTVAPTTAPLSVADTYFLPMSIAIILVIVIIGVALALLMTRKRP